MQEEDSMTTYVGTLNKLTGCSSKSAVLIVLPGCPHCEAAVRFMTSAGLPFAVLPRSAVSAKILDAMAVKLGHSSYPRVFVGGTFVGGNAELQKKNVTQLKKLIGGSRPQTPR